MSMGSDTAHDADTLKIHHDMREQHINLAGIRAQIWAAREFDAAAAMAGTPRPAPSPQQHQAPVCSDSHSVAQRTKHLPADDTEGGIE